jgi:phosphotransferase family enzyme
MAGRTVSVVVTHHGECLGGVGPFEVENPWWSEVEAVVDHLRAVLGVPVVVLRLVDVVGGRPMREGHVIYHAEALDRPAVRLPPADGTGLAGPEPFRATWATAEGARAALAWAAGHAPGEPRQFKTWNLAALFRLGDAWLKLTPPFAAYEPAVAALVRTADPTLVAIVLADDAPHRRMLLAHIPGRDCFDASPALIASTVTRWVAAQAELSDATADGIPARPADRLPADLRRLLDGEAGAQLDPGERDAAEKMAVRLPDLVAELAECGLPAKTLVHGDFHPGNWRAAGDDGARVIDLADAYFGHPVFDGERLRVFVGPDRAGPVVDAWCEAWRRHRPGADPRRALRLARPLQEVAGAVTYQMFLDNIEASERRYHAPDPVAGLRDAVAACAELTD